MLLRSNWVLTTYHVGCGFLVSNAQFVAFRTLAADSKEVDKTPDEKDCMPDEKDSDPNAAIKHEKSSNVQETGSMLHGIY